MPHIRFSLAGSFEAPFRKLPANGRIKQILPEHAMRFWQDEHTIPFADRPGCYIFALRNSNGCTPWYVGKTRIALSAEIFTPDKLNKYNEVLFDENIKGTPVMFFVTRQDGGRTIQPAMLEQMEKFLIQTAKIKNPDLINIAHTRNIWSIDGVHHSKKGPKSKIGDVFKKMMGLS